MIPTTGPTKYLSGARRARISCAHQSQRIFAYRSGDSYIRNASDGVPSPRVYAGVFQIAIKNSGMTRRVLVAYLGAEWECGTEYEQEPE
jgi:hypothetical protein